MCPLDHALAKWYVERVLPHTRLKHLPLHAAHFRFMGVLNTLIAQGFVHVIYNAPGNAPNAPRLLRLAKGFSPLAFYLARNASAETM